MKGRVHTQGLKCRVTEPLQVAETQYGNVGDPHPTPAKSQPVELWPEMPVTVVTTSRRASKIRRDPRN